MIGSMQPYDISTEFNFTQMLEHFDSNYIYDILTDKLENINYTSSMIQPNIIGSFESNFKIMQEKYSGDSANINLVRQEMYNSIINILCNKFGLEFNDQDPNIDLYSAAFYLYEFLVCKRNDIMINFFTLFIVNNKDSLYNALNLDEYKKNRDSSAIYGKRIYDDAKFAIISANIQKVINHIATMDIRLVNIFQSTYDPLTVQFLDNAFRDTNNFFKNYYCDFIVRPEVLPVVITNIRLSLQRLVGNIQETDMHTMLQLSEEEPTNE